MYVKYYTLIICLLCFTLNNAIAQNKTGLKLLKKQDYTGAFSAFEQDLNNGNEAIIAHYNIGKLYFNQEFEQYNIDSAFAHFLVAEQAYKMLRGKEREKVQKQDESIKGLKRMKRDVSKAAYAVADEKATVEAYNYYLTTYANTDRTLENKMAKARNALAFKRAKALDTPNAYETLIETYKKSLRTKTPAIFRQAQILHFQRYIEVNSWTAFEEFAEKYKYNVFIRDSLKSEFDRCLKKNNLNAYKIFAENNAESAWAQLAIDSIAVLTLKKGATNDFEHFINAYPKHTRMDEIWKAYYKKYVQEYGKESIRTFMYTYQDYPYMNELKMELGEYDSKQEDKAWRQAQYDNTFQSYHDFINYFQMSERIDEATSKMYEVITADSMLNQYIYFVESFPDHERVDSMWMKMYRLHFKLYGTDIKMYRMFESKYPKFPYKAILEADKAEAAERKRKEVQDKKKTGGK